MFGKSPMIRKSGRRAPYGVEPLNALQKEVDRIFEDFSSGFGLALTPSVGQWAATETPKVDVSETEREVRIEAELPGLDEKDISVTLGPDSVTLEGEKRAEEETKEKNFCRSERFFGSFVRTIALPAEVNDEKAEASFRRGVLTITLPKKEGAASRTRKVPIRAG